MLLYVSWPELGAAGWNVMQVSPRALSQSVSLVHAVKLNEQYFPLQVPRLPPSSEAQPWSVKQVRPAVPEHSPPHFAVPGRSVKSSSLKSGQGTVHLHAAAPFGLQVEPGSVQLLVASAGSHSSPAVWSTTPFPHRHAQLALHPPPLQPFGWAFGSQASPPLMRPSPCWPRGACSMTRNAWSIWFQPIQ